MNQVLLDQIVEAVLYEGYILYPYRPSSKKNRRERFTFGRVYPEAYSRAQAGAEPFVMQTQCLVAARQPQTELEVCVRFLQPMAREVGVLAPRTSAQSPSLGVRPSPGAATPASNPAPGSHSAVGSLLRPGTGALQGQLPHQLVQTPGIDTALAGQGEPAYHVVPELRIGERLFQTWHEAVEREVRLPLHLIPPGRSAAESRPIRTPFSFPASRTVEPIGDPHGQIAGLLVRRQHAVEGTLELSSTALPGGLSKVTVRVLNQTPVPSAELADPDVIILRTFASTHTILHTRNGEFVSLLAPPDQSKAAASSCQNLGTWPVLVGDEQQQERDTLLSSPIILYDYPKIAPQSSGPLFDGTEIDEILTLRVLTLSEQEKLEMRQVDEQARRLLERTESLSQDALLQLHGTMHPPASPAAPCSAGFQTCSRRCGTEVPVRSADQPPNAPSSTPAAASPPSPAETSPPIDFDDFFGPNTALKGVSIGGVYLQPGDRVRIRPKARADAIDMALAGQTAIIEAVEQDLERRIHLALVIEQDPGKDLGLLRQPGHRFFYGIDEVEPLG